MPLFFLVAGIAAIWTAILGTSGALLKQLEKDFGGNGSFKTSFGVWVVAICAIGALGYVPGLKSFSNGLLVLVVLVMLLSNKGFFTKLQSALGT